MSKLKEFYLKNKTAVILAVLTSIILLANFFHFLWPVAIPFILIFFTTCSFGEMVSYIVYLSVISGVNEIYASAMVWMFILTAIRYTLDVKNKRKPFYKAIFFLTIAISVLFSIIPGDADIWGFFNGILIVCLLFFVYFAFVYFEEINIKKSFDLLFVSILVSSVLGFVIFQIGAIQDVIYPFDGVFFRLRLFTRNPNHLAISALFSMAFILYEIVSFDIEKDKGFSFLKNKTFWMRFVSVLFLICVGLMSMSKAFLLVCVILICYLILNMLILLKWKSLLVIAPMIAFVAVCAIVFKEKTVDIIARFSTYDVWNSFFSKVFSGRTTIWCAYRDHIRSSIFTMLFGAGLFTKDLIDIGPHNSFIYIAYRMGFVGVVLLGVLVYLYVKASSKKICPTIKNIVVFAVFMILSLEETILSDRFFLLLVFGIVLMLRNKEKYEQIDE